MELDLELVDSFCDECGDLLVRWERICLDLQQSYSNPLIEELFRIAHNLKGGSRAVGLLEFGNYIHKIEDAIARLKDRELEYSNSIQALLLSVHQYLDQWIQNIRSRNFEAPEHRHHYKMIESVFGTSLAVEGGGISPFPEGSGPSKFNFMSSKNREQQRKKKRPSKVQESIRISAQKLDQILQTIGELSIQQNILWHCRENMKEANPVFHKSLQLGQKLVRELYDKALGLRMQPLESLFQRLERNIIELSATLNKQIEIKIVGSDVELDKAIIEKITDPLTHIVRNAIDHGIESRDRRTQLGKTEKGLIEIKAKQDTFGILISIADDGQGLDPLKIREKALAKGLLDPASSPSTKELLQYIFLPGFSTAEKLTEVSGRGVGMDVVGKTISEINGKIEMQSSVNVGTQFSITLPTSVNIIEGMLIRLEGQVFVIPISAVDEVLDVHIGETGRIHNGLILPLVELASLLKYQRPTDSTKTLNPDKVAILFSSRGVKIGFVCDRVLSQQQVVVRPLSENIEGSFGVLGGTVLGSGEPGLILNLQQLADFYMDHTNLKGMAA